MEHFEQDMRPEGDRSSEVTLTKDIATRLLDVLPRDHEKAELISGLLQLYIDDTIESHILESELAKHDFYTDTNCKQATVKALQASGNEQRLHMQEERAAGRVHLEKTLDLLSKKSSQTKKAEHCYIRLKEFSGLTQYPERMNCGEILSLLSEILDDRKEALDVIKRVENYFMEWDIYTEGKDYEVEFAVGSNRFLKLLVSHYFKRTQLGYNGCYFIITNQETEIVDILTKIGYQGDTGTLADAFSPIVPPRDGIEGFEGGGESLV